LEKAALSLTLAPKTAKAFFVKKKQRLRVIDVEGKQVGDFIAFNSDNPREKLSQARTRAFPMRFTLKVGDKIYSDRDHPMFTIKEDTCGVHDLIWQPCSRWVYKNRFGADQDGCTELLARALADSGYSQLDPVDPFNLFMNTRIYPDGRFEIVEPVSKPGDYIELIAEMNCLCVLSTCPNEFGPTNGGKITPLKVMIFD
jgi:uncharacterized protein